ncbi:methylosome subunit pICln [Cyclospora cayetanensis]|uniref:Methylosome subunit pICln n=1 Tax=Cyclospora cayetanensis TaxID=88456 RepID=A0A6P6S229_9EIME|nr:methylosome subunit pICln [Cyclospora cayetanensis]
MSHVAQQNLPTDFELREGEAIGIRVPDTTVLIQGKDAGTCERPCLYCQVKGDTQLVAANGQACGTAPSGSDEAIEDSEEPSDYDAMVELKFIPDDSSCLQQVFSVMSEMAALHPDPESAVLDGDEDELFDEAALRRQGWEFVENEGRDATGGGTIDDEA